MSFILSNKKQEVAQIADEESSRPKLLSQESNKNIQEELSKEINYNINIEMENSSEIINKPTGSNFAIYSLILAGAVILGVVGYIYFSVDKNKTESKSPQ
jgi:preprotein translocase subunit Sss1